MVLGHLNGPHGSGSRPALQAAPCWNGAPPASADDVVVVHGRRTAIARGGRGGFKVRPWVRAPGVRWRQGAGWVWLLCSVPLGAGGGSAPEL